MSTSTKEPSAKRKSGDDAPTPQKKLSPQTISYLKDWIMSPEHMVRDFIAWYPGGIQNAIFHLIYFS